MSNTTPSGLGIEIGKAQAMAEASQKALQAVETHLSDRMDRFEDKVDQRFTGLEKKFDDGISEIKLLLNNHHSEITTIKIKASHDEGEKKNKTENRSSGMAILALIVALLGVASDFISSYFNK